ncbi:type 1 glutamine amidotransferase domain-containing protein [Nesterenkonia flava]|uniref:Type 1 glutamine amidotransferase domain-containing protein n=1 Tax=Nesterenkonia flava TaxID=469799 RepID=A0ABU1FX40_9MICC|nr:type 1 glutamine amidotransferase domain-containing protein [Nesterenkonia flava]MDR5712822.1 type 1 glutamine amidotransferase domain-containing protein [Nesterenkonia flava]
MAHITGKKIALLTTNGVEQPELTEPVAAIKEHGGTPVIVSPEEGQIQAMKGDWEHADHFDVDVTLDAANPEDYDGLVLPGGTLNADTLRIDENAQKFVKAFFDAGKPVAAICHGPWILTEIGAAKGRTVTSYPSLKTDLLNAGAEWVDDSVVVSNGLVTSRTPDDLEDFNREFLNLVSDE